MTENYTIEILTQHGTAIHKEIQTIDDLEKVRKLRKEGIRVVIVDSIKDQVQLRANGEVISWK